MRRARSPALPAARQRGVGLIEVLVAVLVLTIGLLGAAALQATALRGNQASYERTQVSILTQSIFDAMRANVAGVTGGAYETSGWVCSPPAAGTLAASDTSRWITNVQAQINPGACGSITCTGRACTVGVRWDDSRPAGGSATQVVQMRAQL